MGVQDLIITPIYLISFLVLSFFLRRSFTNPQTKKYFIPALTFRFAGAIGLGFIYQFYYPGGDTFNYYHHSTQIWDAFLSNPIQGLTLIFKSHVIGGEYYEYTSKMYWYRDQSSYFVCRLAGLVALVTFNTYSTIALFFGAFSFSGTWAMYSQFQKRYPYATKYLAYAILFLPSMVFWGSGILKDSICIGALTWVIWAMIKIYDERRISLLSIAVIFFGGWILFVVKVYILLCLIPSVFIWIFLSRLHRIKNVVAKVVVSPILALFILGGGFYAAMYVTKDDQRYSLDKVAERAQITAYDIRYYTGRDAGSGYSIGDQDGTWNSMIRLAPYAVNVSFFRPYLWEVNNPLMAFASVESFILLVLSMLVLFKNGSFKVVKEDPLLLFCLIFSIIFAFAVGVSTYNFGTLVRYKLPAILLLYPTIALLMNRNLKSLHNRIIN